MFVEQEKIGPTVGRHEQGQGLALAAREAADGVVEAVFQAHAERPDPVAELGDRRRETARPSPRRCPRPAARARFSAIDRAGEVPASGS